MKSVVFVVIVVVLTCSVGNQVAAKCQSLQVRWVGSLQDVRQDRDFSGHIKLRKLAGLKHLYAVGPVEGLRGEITIWDSKPLVSEVIDGKVVIAQSPFDKSACFLVYTQNADWQSEVSQECVTDQTVARQIESLVEARGCSVETPFVFLISGIAKQANYHILHKDETAHDVTGHLHENAKVRFTLSKEPVEVLGFYSKHHQGVFTAPNSLVHMHIRTSGDKAVGHLDSIELEPGSTISLPEALPAK